MRRRRRHVVLFAAINATEGDAPITLTAPTSGSPAEFVFTSSNPQVATVQGNKLTILLVGTSTITAQQPQLGSYNPTSTSALLTVKARVCTAPAVNAQWLARHAADLHGAGDRAERRVHRAGDDRVRRDERRCYVHARHMDRILVECELISDTGTTINGATGMEASDAAAADRVAGFRRDEWQGMESREDLVVGAWRGSLLAQRG